MTRARFAIFGLVLAAAVAVAVSTLTAQTTTNQDERRRPRVLMMDGRGAEIGVSVSEPTAEELKKAGGATGGVRIEDVNADSPASKAGLKEGDIVVEFDGERVRSARQFSRLVQETPGGRTVRLGVVRDGKRETIEVTPEARGFAFGFDGERLGRDIARSFRDIEPRLRELEPRLRELEPRLRELEPRLRELEPRLREFRFDGPEFDFDFDFPNMSGRGRLGVQVETLGAQLADYFGVKDGGVLVAGVTAGSAAEKAGLKAGDVITAINGDRVRSASELTSELRGASGEVTIEIVRDKKTSTLKATLDDREDRRRPVTRRPAV